MHVEQDNTLSLICTIIYLVNFGNDISLILLTLSLNGLKCDKLESLICKVFKIVSLEYKMFKMKLRMKGEKVILVKGVQSGSIP